MQEILAKKKRTKKKEKQYKPNTPFRQAPHFIHHLKDPVIAGHHSIPVPGTSNLGGHCPPQ